MKSTEAKLKKVKAHYYKNRVHILKAHRKSRLALKEEVLTKYGKNGKLLCCWSGCDVSDIDMLTLDHINNDGASDRKTNKGRSGFRIYTYVRAAKFPSGFQTLCMNHQLKKEILRKRSNVQS